MLFYKIRIDQHLKAELICKGIQKYAFCYENNPELTNPHMHFYVETDLKRASLVARVKKLPDYTPGNGFYSLRELKPETSDDRYIKYLAYLLKQKDTTFIGFDDEQLSEIKAYNERVVAQMAERKEKKKPVLDQIIEKYQYNSWMESHEHPPTNNQVIDDVIDFYKVENKLVREFAMVSQVQTILLRFNPQYALTLNTNIHKAIDKARI